MQKTQIKTLTLLYHAKEDRMILLLNKDDVDRMVYWITRRFYFSLFFELDTYLDNLGIVDKSPISHSSVTEKSPSDSKDNIATSQSKVQESVSPKEKKHSEDFLEPPYILLENVSLSQTQDKKRFILVFKAANMLGESILNKDEFINFYNLMKTSFPRGEWGII